MAHLFLFLLGLCVGSFLNVVIYREAKGQSWSEGRSFCDHCKKKIPWYDNLPLLSYLLLCGQCRFCHKKISLQYPLVELFTGLEFVLIFWFFKNLATPLPYWMLFVWLGLASVATVIFVADLRYQIIPDTAIIAGVILILLNLWLTGSFSLNFLLSGVLASLFFFLLLLVTRSKGMGMGDIKLAFLMGLVLGFPKILLALYFAFLTGAILGVILILLGRKKLKSKLAFGPFLISGTVFALVFGEKLWQFLMFRIFL